MNRSDGGAVTPEMQYEWLKKYAHLEGIVGNSKYFVYNIATGLDVGFQVIVVDGKPVQVMKMTKDEAKTIVACSKLKFGDF